MELDTIKQQTTWNDAASSINSNFSKLKRSLTPLDAVMSDTSTNGVQNKVVKDYIDTHPKYEILDEIIAPEGGGGGGATIVLDIEMSDTSTNGVQNKVIKAYVDAVSNRLKVFEGWFKEYDKDTIYTEKNFSSMAEISANGLSHSGGTSSGGLNVLIASSLGKVTSEDNTTTFSAYAIDTIYKRLIKLEENGGLSADDYYTKDEVDGLFTKSNIKSVLQISDWALKSTEPSYDWSDILSRPTALSDFTNDAEFITRTWAVDTFVTEYWLGNNYASLDWIGRQGYATQTWVGNNYLALTGGAITGNLTVNGYIKIGSATLTWKSSALEVDEPLYSTGEISANGLYTSSDMRFKNKIEDISLDLDTIANAPMFKYTWNNRDDNSIHIGSSAQYWEEHAKELVSIDDKDFHRLDYSTLGVLMGISLAKRIKELEMKIGG